MSALPVQHLLAIADNQSAPFENRLASLAELELRMAEVPKDRLLAYNAKMAELRTVLRADEARAELTALAQAVVDIETLTARVADSELRLTALESHTAIVGKMTNNLLNAAIQSGQVEIGEDPTVKESLQVPAESFAPNIIDIMATATTAPNGLMGPIPTQEIPEYGASKASVTTQTL